MLYTYKTNCCGCEACSAICPKNIIHMQEDEEGFLYPELIDDTKCIKCNRCDKVCPVKHSNDIQSDFIEAYAGWAANDEDIILSSSGGFAAILSRAFIKSGGIVFGVVYEDNCRSVVYKRVIELSELEALRGSKYAQALKRDIYRLIKTDLNEGKDVLFFGTPCDSYAVKRLFSKYPNLYIASIICHGPTSLLVHNAFCEALENTYNSRINGLTLRHKNNGEWKPYYIKASFENGLEYIEKFEGSSYDIAFQYFKRPACSDCKFKNNHFAADVLIGDNHSAKAGDDDYNCHGASSILILSEKGKMLLDMVRGEDFILIKTEIERHIRQKAIHSSVKRNNDRSKFVELLHEYGLDKACKEISILRNLVINRMVAKKNNLVIKTKSVIKYLLGMNTLY